MSEITFPLKPRQRGSAVAALQDVLIELLRLATIETKDDAARSKLVAALAADRAKSYYGAATQRVVGTFQSKQKLKSTGVVDEATAKALNELFNADDSSNATFQSPLTAGAVGPDVAALQDILLGLAPVIADQTVARHAIARQEIADQRFGATTAAAVAVWQRNNKLAATGAADLNALKLLYQQGRATPRTVHGVVRLGDGSPVAGLIIEAFDRDFRSEQPLGRSPTDRQGRYHIAYTPKASLRDEKRSADLGVRVFTADGKTELYVTSSRELVMNALRDAVIDVTVSIPVGMLPSEFERIATDVRSLVRDEAFDTIAPTAQPDEANFLARETGFDEERIAHFIVAHRLTKLAEVRPDYFYALLREDGLFGIGPNRPRIMQMPVGIQSDVQAVLYEAVLLDTAAAKAAVIAAVHSRTVPPSLEEQFDEINRRLNSRWRQQAERYSAQELPQLIVGQIGDLIAAGKAPEILALLGSFDPFNLPNLFETLDGRNVFVSAKRSEAKARLDLGALIGFHAALMNELTQQVNARTEGGVRSLAALDEQGWTEHLARAVKSNDPQAEIAPAQARRLSATLASRFEATYPTTAFAAKLERRKPASVPKHAEVVKFFGTVPQFELRKHRIVPFLKQQGIDPKTVQPDVLASVEKLQRVFHIAGSYDKTEGLLQAGFGAAADIVAAGKSRFLAESKKHAALDETQATELYAKARNINAGTIILASNLRAPSLPAIIEGSAGTALAGQIQKIVAEQPDLKSLFGSMDACECDECRNIYGAPAYLADAIGSFLRHRLVKDAVNPFAPSTPSAKDVLFKRAPDIGEIDLDCNNANIVVPHIDLCCEKLEDATTPDGGSVFNGVIAAGKASQQLLDAVRAQNLEITDTANVYGPYGAGRFMLRDKVIVVEVDPAGPGTWTLRRLRQTHGTNEERAASPEYVNAAAYVLLKNGKAAFELPFDLFHTETRALLAAAGVARAELMEALAVGGDPTKEAIAGEMLGLSANERALIFASSLVDQPTIWGVAGLNASATMALLNVFMEKTQLEYREVDALIKGTYVAGGLKLFIHHQDLSCDTSKKDIANLDDTALDRIHRVLRLARRTKLAARDIDRLAVATKLGNGDLGAGALKSLADLVLLAAELNVDVARLVTWLDVIPIDAFPTTDDRSEHALIFQNVAVTGPLSADLTPAAIRANEVAETTTLGSGKKLADYAADLALAFGARSADLALLLARVSDATLLGPSPPLTFRALAAVYGRIGLARALGWTIANELGLERLSGLDPLASSTSLRDFVKAVRRIEKAGATIADLEYRLARRAPDLSVLDLGDAAAARALKAMRAAILKAAIVNKSPYDDALMAVEQVVPFEALLQRQPSLDAPSVAKLVDIVRLDAPTGADGTAAKAVVDAELVGALDATGVKNAIDAVVAAPIEANRTQFLKLVMNGLSASALQAAAVDAAVAEMATLVAMPSDMTEAVLRGARLQIGANRTALLDLLSTGDIANSTIALTTGGAPNLYRALRLARAVVGVLAPFKSSAETVAFMLKNAPALGWLGLDETPFEVGGAVVPLTKWIRLAEAFALFGDYPAVPRPGQPDQTVSVTSVLVLALAGGGNKSPLLDELAALTGWKRDLIGEADTRLAFAHADYLDPETWRKLGRVVIMIHTLGVPMAEAVRYTADALTDSDRVSARRMLRALYNSADWLGALKSIMDPIRERKRDALVAHLLATNPNINSKADLYDHFLTPTEWSAKMPSSRIVDAHSRVQLFIQRCISGLEPQAVADLDGDRDWGIWETMSDFRVWQVTRMVWAEAQYYIRPTWRDDKTEAFVEFENAVRQNEVNAENVTAACEGYLDRLDEIAFLDVQATCYDFYNDSLHIFACTKGGDPPVYFHRVLQSERVFTPWAKVNLDISNNLVAFFRDKRLFLAWTTFIEKGDDQQPSAMPQDDATTMPAAQRYTEIRLAISEYTGSKWLPRRVSRDFLVTPNETKSLDLQRIFLSVNVDEARFTIDVYLGPAAATYLGSFLLAGCKGYPEVLPAGSSPSVTVLPRFLDTELRRQTLVEKKNVVGLLAYSTAANGTSFQTLFKLTPDNAFRIAYPFQASEIDRLLTALINAGSSPSVRERTITLMFGTLMPFFFDDNERGYMLVPGFYSPLVGHLNQRTTVKTFSNVRHLFVDAIALITKYLLLLAAAPTPAQKQAVIDAFPADPETQRILKEVESYGGTNFGFEVRNFYHPLACYLRQRFFEGGAKLLLARETQLHVGPFVFETGYHPSPLIVKPYPKPEWEFDRNSAYAAYNWELALHIPHLVGVALMEAEQYNDAEVWFRYVFDPLGSSNDPAPKRYWNAKPFYLRTDADYKSQVLTTLMERVAKDPTGAIETELAYAILDWRRNPLKPYLIGRSRTVVFQQAIVDQTARLYIARGDSFFRRDQLQDLVMAELDYSRAERLIGKRPKVIPPPIEVPPATYNQLESDLDLFGNAMRRLENLLPDLSVLPEGGAELPPLPVNLESLYFCIPPSDKLFELWDLLEERQANLRNSRTIDGVERTLSIFAPPLSVEAMIAAAASGLSISAIMAGLSAPRPPYRFRVMVRHAIECAEAAIAMSRSLEQALTSRDGEGLSRLKAQQEIQYLKEQTYSLTKEIESATKSIGVAQQTKRIHQETQSFYAGRPYMNEFEIAATAAYGASLALQVVMAVGYIAAGGLSLVPKFMVGAAGFGGSPTANMSTGGDLIGSAARDLMVGTIGALASALDKTGSMLEHQANYRIRSEDWAHQAKLAKLEMDKADIEIAIASIRETIAKEQLRLHGVKSAQAAAEEAYLRTKFTNRELFDWLAQQLRGLSRQMFNVAFETAKAAEYCFNFELGVADSFVRSGQWDDKRRGLLAAENLAVDLRRMESAYFKRNVRGKEITKEISLARLDPIALLELRTTGRCVIQIPEAFLDLEHSGDYFRRIAWLTVRAPLVAGPYTSVPIRLTQTSNRLRVSTARNQAATSEAAAYAENVGSDSRFRYNVGSIQSFTTSRADDDGGTFSHDMADERYWTFEGSPLVGTFLAELPQALHPFHYGTISDLVITVRYAAKDGGGAFRKMVDDGLREQLNAMALSAGRVGLFHAFDLRRDRPDLWNQLTATGKTSLKITRDDLPYYTSSRAIAINATRFIARVKGAPANFPITVDGAAANLTAPPEKDLAGLLATGIAALPLDSPKTFATAAPGQLEEAVVIVNYAMA